MFSPQVAQDTHAELSMISADSLSVADADEKTALFAYQSDACLAPHRLEISLQAGLRVSVRPSLAALTDEFL